VAFFPVLYVFAGIGKLSGNYHNLKANQEKRLRRLADRRIRDDLIISQDLAREICSLSKELGRQIGILIDRQGHVRNVIVGDAHRIFIPEMPRNRSVRLRGLRLVHSHLHREPLSEEDLADLTLLRLDYITAVTIDDAGFPAQFYSAHVLPGRNPGYLLEDPVSPGKLPEGFSLTISHLENLFEREEARVKSARIKPGAILVGVYTPEMRARRDPDDAIQELNELCITAGLEVADIFIQKKSHVDPGTVIGSGKAREISIKAVQENVEILIFDHELTPAQATRLSKICDLKIIDRTQLILDIFARNAKSRDGKLQVELAQLRYLKGRLSEKDDNMSRLTGGIGGRGPGETKLEIGRRRVEEKISRLEKELKSLKHRRGLNRIRRDKNNIPVVSIVGYTNAGKSTLLNAMTNSEVIAENRLFATLDPTTRRLRFPEEKEIIISDTVGFIHDLPPELKRAFEATLEELAESSLLLLCIDAVDREKDVKIRAVEAILNDMGLSEIPVIKVFNKCEALSEEERNHLSGKYANAIAVSALHKINLDTLHEAIEEFVFTKSEKDASFDFMIQY